ncbi:hypothetical protein NADFUDRAFT_47053 [Nadsonia fulvescens var. elongata DSM 6958]|uniref:Phosphatidate phosphatase APP1 catalytic domain-containing protein n=1 Tax=Nadsonia fulvescens var. elongata DSM 6958 TaxID=857566 RepID=A0A1E3PJ37_9ASCO|nr:hypothetical protein NADFUDRAFT_47053 [Nadsonia fulvescens var. elongata DSM 6958]
MSSLPPGRSSSSLSSLASSFTDNGNSSKREKVFGYLKSKRDEYLSSVDLNATKQNVSDKLMRGYAGASSSISSMTSSGSSSSGAVIGFDNITQKQLSQAKLAIYPSYSRLLDNSEYQVDVKGYISLPGLATRKNRLLLGLARQIIGIKSVEINDATSANSQCSPERHLISESNEDLISLNSSDEEEVKIMKLAAMDTKVNHPNTSTPFKDPAISFTPRIQKASSMPRGVLDDRILKDRLSPFVSRPILNKRIILKIGPSDEYLKQVGTDGFSNDDLVTATIYTDNNGRFSHRLTVKYPPGVVIIDGSNPDELVYKGDDVISTILPAFIPPQGISVISDIDDTIKHTGITGDKRNMFRNVFVKDFKDIGVKDVNKWYKAMEAACVKVNDYREKVHFHYVSNSPWQLFTPITKFIQEQNFPAGTFHLKTYTGLISGILEPAAGRKKANLERILRDFPERKFVLIGDSGEGDLEAYTDLVINYPTRILAIFIRDITTPANFDYGKIFDMERCQIDWQGLDSEPSDIEKTNREVPDDLINLETNLGHKTGKVSTILPSRSSSSSVSSMPLPPPPPPPPRRRGTVLSSTSPSPSSSTETEIKTDEPVIATSNSKKAKSPPQVPRKPVALRSSAGKILSAENLGETSSNSTSASEQNPKFNLTSTPALDLSIVAPPPLPKRSDGCSSTSTLKPSATAETASVIMTSDTNRFRSRTRSNSANIYDFSDYEDDQVISQLLDRKIDGWVRRLEAANNVLTAKNKSCKLILWRDGQDNRLIERSCEIIRKGLSYRDTISQGESQTENNIDDNGTDENARKPPSQSHNNDNSLL